ncbi:MGH1-like glycoside hydrolase domain-containing protein [Nakamurella endophytica]|uniref:Glucosidase n=1 Tax=Nakamurella endophytica TaxID=1748367 RepID=A0A917SLK2_9ACTN|nr:glucosidase [Nakamurella endophytica]GGL87958.1 glucosidase [Nakamurella endophytica]
MTSGRPQPRTSAPPTAEHTRLAESPSSADPWRLWGPYLSGRQWGTVREDYSADGDAWSYLPFEQAHARAYRWGEDGLGGICDRFGFLNFSVALWNGRDPVLKERLYGLTNGQGNHGEDVKEYWWPLDGTPTHSFLRWLYRYPQAEYPYARLREENARRGRDQREFELADTGVLDGNRFFDVVVEYAKAAPDDLCIRIDATNHGPDPADLHLVPQIWYRNTWSWGLDDRTPELEPLDPGDVVGDMRAVVCRHEFLGRYTLSAQGRPEVLVCDNESNDRLLFGTATNPARRTKDGINQRIVHGDTDAVATEGTGTKAGFWYRFDAVPPGATVSVRLRLSTAEPDENTFGAGFHAVFGDRAAEADEFYGAVLPAGLTDDRRAVARRAYAGLLWGKQLYRYDVHRWLQGDPAQPPPPDQRRQPSGRNTSWEHLSLADVISMPDEWEYPWFASWDLAFHCVALSHVDPAFAKEQLLLLAREWAMHPDGQLPAYEWAFGDVNPPVHAWAAWHVYQADGAWDTDFLVRIGTKMLLNFAWWVNRKDADGSNLFEGGFLGMDNIGLFNRSAPLPAGFRLEQSDATSWMAFFCLQMLRICVEAAHRVPAFDELATKFLEHFLSIAHAMRSFGSQDVALWDEEDGFFYDVLVHPDGGSQRLRVRSMVGLLPLLAVAVLPERTAELPDFSSRLAWLRRRRPELLDGLVTDAEHGGRVMLSLLLGDALPRLLARMFDEQEFLSVAGIRSLSAAYSTPYTTEVDGRSMTIDYEPGESRSGLFGGNSNWRGPVWFPVNVLLADALRAHGNYLGDDFRVEVPTGSGNRVTLAEAADLIDQRLVSLFLPGPDGRRPSDGHRIESSPDPLWAAHPTFSEYFDGDTGEGLGATHQTGWTALVADLLQGPDGR